MPAASVEAGSGYALLLSGFHVAIGAATVTLALEEKGSVDLHRRPIASVDGIVTSTSSQPVSNIQVSLVNTAFAVPGISPGNARADAQGAFKIPNVPPGQYTLIARATTSSRGCPTSISTTDVDRGNRTARIPSCFL
jgi:hypothetical protein